MKALKIILAVAVVSVLGVYLFFQFYFKLAVPSYEGKVTVEGIASNVEVHTDDYGIPHLVADNDTDLFFAQGYIIARERMFQMEISRLAGRGELSSLFGEATIEKDRFLKTVGFHRLAQAGYQAMSPESRKIVDAYVAGINACISDTTHLPREYTIMRTKPGRWQPEDCVATALLMAYSLTRSKLVDLVLYRIGEHAGEEFVSMIAPAYPDFAPTLTGLRKSPAPGGISKRTFHRFGAVNPWKMFTNPVPIELPASNWMIFSGQLTTTGRPIFAGSPDLKPTLPALFYMMHLKSGSFDVTGGAMPGVPGIGPLGYNGDIAWSAVNGRGDEMDYYVEKTNPDNANQYLTPDGYRDFTIIQETLRIKTKKGIREEKFAVKVSRHGPIISAVMPMAPENCAMKWAAFEQPATDIEGLLDMNRADNFERFRSALSKIKNTNLGIGYADEGGNIGWQFTASPPIRKNGDGTFPVPGWTDNFEWTGYIPFEELPFDYNPASGYVASFNNDPGNVPYHLTNYYLFERAIRFEEIMQARGDSKIGIEDVKNMQLDKISVVAQRWVPLVLKACQSPEFSKYMDLFKDWDFSVGTDSTAGTLYNAFYAHLLKNTLSDEVGEKLWVEGLSQSYLYYIPDLVLTKIAQNQDHAFYDDIRTEDKRENRDDIIRRSISEAVLELTDRLGKNPEKWQWGEVHKMVFEHPLGSKLGFLNLKPIATNGEHHTINSGFWEINNPFKMDAGGVIRMLIDFANPENSTIISPPGQSGIYKSPHYDDLAQLWAQGGQVPLHFFSAKDLSRVLVLTPKAE